jgi:hypothetical protein
LRENMNTSLTYNETLNTIASSDRNLGRDCPQPGSLWATVVSGAICRCDRRLRLLRTMPKRVQSLRLLCCVRQNLHARSS